MAAKGITPEKAEEIAQIPLSDDRFTVAITENISLSGARLSSGFKYRYTVTDRETDVIQKVGYGFTIMDSQAMARGYVAKLVEGRKSVRV